MNYFEYAGHLHVHSSYSDGNMGIEEIARAARDAGLCFVGVTDHNTLKGLKDGMEGWYGSVLVLIGIEINQKKNHYIAFGPQGEVPQDEDNPQTVIDAVNAQGGFGYLAHPVERGNPFFLDGRCYPWDKPEVTGHAGVEIWNFGSQWRMAYSNKLQAVFWRIADVYRAARHPDPRGVELWDQMLKKQQVNCFGGSDAHLISANWGKLKLTFFPYSLLFRTINTHVLLNEELSGEVAAARGQIYSALRQGRFFIGSDYLAPTEGFRFSAFNTEDTENEVPMGGQVDHSGTSALRILSPSPRSLIRVIKNGKQVYQSKEQVLVFKVLKPGTFRVEVYYTLRTGKAIPWIYSNPIYVK